MHRAAPDLRLNPRQQLQHLKGLGHVIVCADFQSQDFIHQLAARRKHNDGRRNSGLADVPANVIAIFLRQHHIQNHQIISAFNGLAQPLFSIGCCVQRVSFSLQTVGKRHAQVCFVLHQQDSFGHEEKPGSAPAGLSAAP
jgi:hypothetical protein